MRVAVVGAGPAGLYAAYLIKRARPEVDVRVVERNAPDATYGFGVVFSDTALAFLADDDPDTHDAVVAHMEHWDDITVIHRGERVVIDGIGFSAIGRLALLRLLGERARAAGVVPAYRTGIAHVSELGDADLVIGADGFNSVVRRSDPDAFGARITRLTNRYVWYGTDKPFATLSHAFRANADGAFNAHHYRYAPGMSTFVVECDAATFARAGLGEASDAEARAYCEAVFADALDGHALVSNGSAWRRFANLRCARWYAGNRVLVGDALHTAHFSIGSGTRLALEDAIALVAALRAHDFDVRAALPAYQAAREPIVDKILRAADASAAWYEDFATHMNLEPWRFAYSYIQRSGRIDGARLRRLAPSFAGALARRGIGDEVDGMESAR
jgi:2-polyprenyl-6-methoxyphenol hydroxylase-like FAD-dependent oxidoreductase